MRNLKGFNIVNIFVNEDNAFDAVTLSKAAEQNVENEFAFYICDNKLYIVSV